jgi:hypothetical protein
LRAKNNMFGTRSAVLSVALQLAGVSAWGYCNDNDVSCAMWARSKECEGSNADTVKNLCPHSCSVCTHICRDVEPGCSDWAVNGQCTENVDYMKTNCPTSCGLCKPKCYDKDPSCGNWARGGECKKNPSITATCPVSCGICSHLCMDRQNDCPQWAANGDCNSNPGFMLEACPFSCNLCDEKEHGSKYCADRDRNQCLIWGEQECNANPGSVMRLCPELCGLCTLACEDKHEDCPGWAKAKDGKGCEADSDYMHEHCPYSCGTCSKLEVLAPKEKTEL